MNYPKIIDLPANAYYFVDQPPRPGQIAALKATIATLLALALTAWADTINQLLCPIAQQLDIITLATPALRVITAALIIELATQVAGLISPAYVGVGG